MEQSEMPSKTDLINKLEFLDLSSFVDYNYMISELRHLIYSIDEKFRKNPHLIISVRDEKDVFDNNSLNYIKSIYDQKLELYFNNFFRNDELIREIVKREPEKLNDIGFNSFYYMPFGPRLGIGEYESGISAISKMTARQNMLRSRLKSDYYIKPRELRSTVINKSNKGCFVATYTYGSDEDVHVQALRKFRDEHLVNYKLGSLFIQSYYEHSPSLVKWLEYTRFPRIIPRVILNLIVKFILYQKNDSI